jgi:ribonuclease R
MLSDSTILKHIARQPKRSAGFKQLVRELGLHGEARGTLDAQLEKLVAAGELVQLNSDRYALPQPAANKNEKNLVVGRLTMHRDGFGFVIPDASSLSPSLKSKLAGDIFIAPHAIGNAMHGDRVLVDIMAVRPDGRAEGRIVRPVVRAHPTVVGIFHYGSRHNSVKPIDSKITMDVIIPEGRGRRRYTNLSIACSATKLLALPNGPISKVSWSM